jgi:hypothetical protein
MEGKRGREREREKGREGDMHDSGGHKKQHKSYLLPSVLDSDGYLHSGHVLLVCLYQLE